MRCAKHLDVEALTALVGCFRSPCRQPVNSPPHSKHIEEAQRVSCYCCCVVVELMVRVCEVDIHEAASSGFADQVHMVCSHYPEGINKQDRVREASA